jgi:MoxR-like ATPase
MDPRDPRELVASWGEGRARVGHDAALELLPRSDEQLAARFRRAYTWIAREAIVSPFHDIEFGEPVILGRPQAQVELPRSSYSSYILLPLLTLATSQRLLFIGAPGRGKTTMATLMGLLAGYGSEEMRRAIQHGHPQLTITDLLGSPLPSELVRAQSSSEIHVAWRKWLSMRAKIIDEYNRIPTKTQSALLSLMAEGYAEMYEQVLHCKRSAWFLTANDDLGGGTFQVIDALKDRIDAVVRCTPFSSQHLDVLVERVAAGRTPEDYVPADIVFTGEELDRAEREVRAVEVPQEVVELLGFFGGQLDFCQRASDRLEFRNKDTLHLAGFRLANVCNEDCPLDKMSNLCTQTENGISARAFQTILLFAKALAWFRGEPRTSTEDLRQVLPWVLHEKLKANAQSAFFQKTENQVLLRDRASWIRQLFDRAVAQHAAYKPLSTSVQEIRRELALGIESLAPPDLRKRLEKVQAAIDDLLRRNELNGPVHEDLVLLKSIHARYSNRAAALEEPAS